MSLRACKECGNQVSPTAKRCPQCGGELPAGKDAKQATGCLITILGIALCFVMPLLGFAVILVGGLYAIINTRITAEGKTIPWVMVGGIIFAFVMWILNRIFRIF